MSINFRVARDSGTIQTPYGLKTVEINHRNWFCTTHRGERLEETTLKRLLDLIEATEQKALAKAEIAARRKALAADPVQAAILVEAHSYWVGRVVRYGKVIEEGVQRHVETHIERITVRGTDQRSGEALITRANGEKESMPYWRLLRPLSESDERDLLAAHRAMQRVNQALNEAAARSADTDDLVKQVVQGTENEGHYGAHAEASYDFATGTYTATFLGKAYTGSDTKDIEEQIRAVVAKEQGYGYTFNTNSDDPALRRVGDRLDHWGTLYRSVEDYQAYQEAERASKAADEAYKATFAEYRFDKSLVAGVETTDA